jgi:glucose uptake protein GlcU
MRVPPFLFLDFHRAVAVEPGNAYQVFNSGVVKEFPSGKLALSIGSNYYNVYVVSQMQSVSISVSRTVIPMCMGMLNNTIFN